MKRIAVYALVALTQAASASQPDSQTQESRGQQPPSDLPHDVSVPMRSGKQITLADLATHRSALPRMPANFIAADPMNPYVDYPVQRLYQFLSSYQLQHDVDSAFEYSNLGAGLLGHALARRAGTNYET